MSEGAGKAQEKRKIQAIKGVRDILPPETALWNRVEQTAHEVFATYGFSEIRLPIIESNELFARSVGEHTEIVSKEMYVFEKKLELLRRNLGEVQDALADAGRLNRYLQIVAVFLSNLEEAFESGDISDTDSNLLVKRQLKAFVIKSIQRWNGGAQTPDDEWRDLLNRMSATVREVNLSDRESLRPEATASVCRAYIEHGMHTLPGNVKLYYMGPMFRYRQFYQIGAEVLSHTGDLKEDARVDAEVIEMLTTFFGKAGLEGAALYINSIGCKECRPKYVELLRAALTKVKDKLGADSQRRIETNPLRVLDSKLESEQAIIEKLPRIAEHLCPDCLEEYTEVKKQLAMRGISYTQNFRLVRGLDYYMRTTFEITAPGLGSQNAVCGGGRYDGLVELLGGPPTKGIGFAIGTDRVILSLQEIRKLPVERALDVYVAWMGEKNYPAAMKIARRLRESGLAVELPPGEMKFGKALGLADKLGARYALIIGDDEVASGQFTVKQLEDGEQKKLGERELVAYLKAGEAP